MTEQEAIKWQEAFKKTYNGTPAEADEACDMAISALEEIQQYRALGTVEEVRKAMERRVPKKAHKYIAFDGITRNGCPNCFEQNGRNEILYAGQKYCSVCGQAISQE